MKKRSMTARLATAGLIAALYVILTVVSSALGLAYGNVQFRISEALTILPVFCPEAIPGLAIGCFLANLGSPFGWFDWVFGTLATLLAALSTWMLRKVTFKKLPILSPVVTALWNALIVGAEVAAFLLPEGFSWSGYLLAILTIGGGELVVCTALGLPLAALLNRMKRRNRDDEI